jgi:N-acyl-D-amino-acid deacylase
MTTARHPVFDLAVLNATIVDGTGGPAYVDDVAVLGDRIERIGPFRGRAARVIDAFGKVLTPGFVDIHGHSDYSLLVDPMARSKVLQGVTTEVGGNCGHHAAPLFGPVAEQRRREQMAACGQVVDWSSSQEHRARLRDASPSINYAQQIGYNTLRSAVTADRAGPLDAGERELLRRLVREEYAGGAVGLSYGLAYAPACFSTTDELVDVARETVEQGGFLSFHLRNEDASLLESLEEALHVARITGAPVHIGHLKTFRRPNWHKIDAAIQLLADARGQGLDLTVDRYPHLAMNTLLKVVLPIAVLEGGDEAMRQRLRDPEARSALVAELDRTLGGEASEILISLVSRPENKQLEGCFLDAVAGERGRSPWDILSEILIDEGDNAFATLFGMNRDNLDRILGLPYAIVASDASVQAVHRQSGGLAHPRSFDTFPYFLAEWVFARNQLDLPAAIRKITAMPAQRAGLTDRGVLAEGRFADLTLIDTDVLRAEVDYEKPFRYPEGVDLVVVNGQIVVDDGRHSGARPGRILGREIRR